MNHNQRGALGTTAIALIAASLFYIPWRIESTDHIAYAPFYRHPVVKQSARIEGTIGSRYVYLDGHPIWWLYGLQLGAIAGAGTVGFKLLAGSDEDETEDSATV